MLLFLCFNTSARYATIIEKKKKDFLLLYQVLFSLQVEQSVIINNNNGMYEFLHKLSNNLRLRNDQENLKIS